MVIRTHPLVALLAAGLFVAGAVAVLLAPGGVGALAAVRVGALTGVQLVGGAALYLLLRRPRGITAAEMIGIGLPLGLVTSLLVDVVFQSTSLVGVASIIFIAVAIVVLGVLGPRAVALSLPSTKEAALVTLAAVPLYLGAVAFWREWPLVGAPWWAVDGDMPIQESVSAAFVAAGPTDSLAVLGSGIRYHWFSNAWAGFMGRAADLAPYQASSRALFAVFVLGLTAIVWQWSRRLSDAPHAGALSVLVIGGASYAGVTAIKAGSLAQFPFSSFAPSFQFGLLAMLALGWVLTEGARRQPPLTTAIVVALLAAGAVGGRVIFLVFVFAGLGAMLVVALRTRQRTAYVLSYGLLAASVSASTIVVLLSVPTLVSSSAEFRLAPNADLALMMSLVPFNGTLGTVLSQVSLLVAMFVGGAGVAAVVPTRSNRWLVAWIAGGATTGVLMSVLTRQIGFSHFSFLAVSVVLAFIASGAGMANAISSLSSQGPPVRKATSVSLLTGVLVGSGLVIVAPMVNEFRFIGLLRWSIPFVAVAVCIAVVVAFAQALQIDRRLTAMLSILAIAAVGIGGGVVAIALRLMVPRYEPDPQQQYAITDQDLTAGRWVQEGTPTDAVFATNRLCLLPSDEPPYCFSSAFTVSALGIRHALVEGASYSVSIDLVNEGPDFDWAVERLRESATFGSTPGVTSARYLWDQGVRYYWVDRLVENAGDWEPYASVVFENDRALILRFNDPSTWSR